MVLRWLTSTSRAHQWHPMKLFRDSACCRADPPVCKWYKKARVDQNFDLQKFGANHHNY